MLHHAFGEVNGKKGVWGHAIGGMGAITQAMARAARAAGAEIVTRCRRARGDRREATAPPASSSTMARPSARKYVASSVNPKLLYTRLVPADALPADFLARIRRWRNGSGTFRMNVALSALPSFTALPGDGDHLTAGIILAPSLGLYGPRLAGRARARLEPRAGCRGADPLHARRHAGARGRSMSRACSASMSRRELPDGKSWDDHREEVADLMIATVDQYAPGFAASVIGRQILSPLDLERQFGLLGGDIFHGALTLNQLFSARPMLGHADYRGPLKGLYHCGSGAHPGGGVTGAPGHNAARVILGDHRALFVKAGWISQVRQLCAKRVSCRRQGVDLRRG